MSSLKPPKNFGRHDKASCDNCRFLQWVSYDEYGPTVTRAADMPANHYQCKRDKKIFFGANGDWLQKHPAMYVCDRWQRKLNKG